MDGAVTVVRETGRRQYHRHRGAHDAGHVVMVGFCAVHGGHEVVHARHGGRVGSRGEYSGAWDSMRAEAVALELATKGLLALSRHHVVLSGHRARPR